MKVRLLNKAEHGLTVGKDYNVIEIFVGENYDEFYVVMNDECKHQTWLADDFDIVEQDIYSPCIYRHFKGEYYAVIAVSEPADYQLLSLDKTRLETMHTETGESIPVYKVNTGRWFHDEEDCKDTLVIYKSLYDNHITYTRPFSMFASIVDKEKYPDAEYDFRFNIVAPPNMTQNTSFWLTNNKQNESISPW